MIQCQEVVNTMKKNKATSGKREQEELPYFYRVLWKGICEEDIFATWMNEAIGVGWRNNSIKGPGIGAGLACLRSGHQGGVEWMSRTLGDENRDRVCLAAHGKD